MLAGIRTLVVAAASLPLLVATSNPAAAQRTGRAAVSDAVQLELTGRVERAFVSESRTDDTRVVELTLSSVALGDDSGPATRGRLPAPGEVLLIVVESTGAAGLPPRRQPPVLRPGDSIRARVHDASRGVWTANGADWFTPLNGRDAAPPQDEPPPDRAAGPSLALRGMRCEAKIVRDRLVIEVVSVDRQGPAADAGFQPGDLIVAIDGKPLASVAAIRRLADGVQPLELAVVDVNSGRLTQVKLAAAPATPPPRDDPRRRPEEADPAAQIEQALGVTLEATRAGGRDAVKVVTVTRGDHGGEAGLEPGDVITAVDDHRVASVADFANALPTRGGRVTLQVRDVRSGREVPVEAEARALRAARDNNRNNDLPRDEPPPPKNAPTADRLGISAELTFYEAEAAVRVVAVKPGSPASRAGLRVGAIILKANNAAVMHPDDLVKAAAAGRVALVVVDPATDRQSTVTLTL